jgi:glycerol uptake facilitator protein
LIGEVFGTFILILLGDGVVANVGLAPRLAAGAYNWNTITLGWAFAVIVAVYVSAGVSGAHLNPAVTISLAMKRGFPWSKVVPYILAQMVGAFLGALAVYLTYRDGLVSTGVPNVWCTGPGSVFGSAFWGGTGAAATGSYSFLTAILTELFGTAVLMWGILASGDSKNTGLMHNLGPFLVGGTVLAVGLSLGGPSGYAINPARTYPLVWHPGRHPIYGPMATDPRIFRSSMRHRHLRGDWLVAANLSKSCQLGAQKQLEGGQMKS